MSSFLRPNTVLFERRVRGAASPTGSDAPAAPVTINANVPARLERDLRGSVQLLVDGITYIRDAVMLVDGLRPYQFIGSAPGQTVTLGGIAYVVAPNAQAAFPDVLESDRATDERGVRYLVLAVTAYALTATLQIELASGRAWAS